MNIDFVYEIIVKQRKLIILTVAATAIITTLLLWLQPPVYKSEAVYTAANPNMGDRSNIYRNQFWEQYFYYGSEVDNDRLMAITQSEEMLRWVADSFQLQSHYRIKDTGSIGLHKTIKQFKEYLQLTKNEFGHAKIMVWDEDKQLAADIANALVAQTQLRALSFSNEMKQTILNKLKGEHQMQRDSLQMLSASSGDMLFNMRKQALLEQLLEKEKLIQQFQTSINEVPALFVIQPALPALKKDKPLILEGTLIASLAAFVFSVLLLLIPAVRRPIS
ncbi:MAG: Wzz/FepE/Etk N-terminal domain-containing protein [Chitinophagaceae bacterium]